MSIHQPLKQPINQPKGLINWSTNPLSRQSKSSIHQSINQAIPPPIRSARSKRILRSIKKKKKTSIHPSINKNTNLLVQINESTNQPINQSRAINRPINASMACRPFKGLLSDDDRKKRDRRHRLSVLNVCSTLLASLKSMPPLGEGGEGGSASPPRHNIDLPWVSIVR